MSYNNVFGSNGPSDRLNQFDYSNASSAPHNAPFASSLSMGPSVWPTVSKATLDSIERNIEETSKRIVEQRDHICMDMVRKARAQVNETLASGRIPDPLEFAPFKAQRTIMASTFIHSPGDD
jgi:hypothetical protein